MVSKATKTIVSKIWNNKCACCGNVDYLEFHHIIPKSKGGSDNSDNIILLCACCHAAIHNRTYSPNNYHNRTSIEYEKAIPILDKYFANQIGTAKTKELLHLSMKTHLSESSLVKRYKREHNLNKFYNNIDLINSKRKDNDKHTN